MKNGLQMNFDMAQTGARETGVYQEGLKAAREKLRSGKEAFTGWVELPACYDKEEVERIKATAQEIRKKCTAFIVIGIGGSYLGARAAVEMLSHSFARETAGAAGPKVYFAGQNISGTYHAELLEAVEKEEVCLCVISKSGTTTECSIAFALLKDALIKKYGKDEAGTRIYAITDAEKGILREETERDGYVSFVVPDDIGGRYSVLTPVGLLPIAAAGIDVDEMLEGALSAKESPELMETAETYAAVRNALYNKGKSIEIFEYYEPKLQYFAEWLKQLFGESEGKDGKGIFPTALQFSTDLHSMGQFLQQGSQVFFETVLNVKNPEKDVVVPESAGELLAGRSMNQVNQAAVAGVMEAHRKADVPILKLELPDLSPRTFGQLVYFFETACGLSSYLMGVNPFNQPGVESYKSEMRAALNAEK